MEQNVVYNIGAGGISVKDQSNLFNDGWKEYTVDVAECNPDIVSNIIGLPGIEDESADSIWASHVVEHVYWHELPDVFNAIVRVLKPNGFGFVMVPNLAAIVDKIKHGLLETLYESPAGPVAAIDMIYGHRGTVRNNQYMQHKTGFTPQSLAMILSSLKINAVYSENDIEIVAIIYKDTFPEFIDDPEFKIKK
jgi:SAM-dependent methyltransferase